MLPAANFAEKDGSFVNSARWIQWKWKAVDPPGDAKPDQEIIGRIFLKVRELYEREGGTFPDPIRSLNWWYSNPVESLARRGVPRDQRLGARGRAATRAAPSSSAQGSSSSRFLDTRADGTTLSGNWLYIGMLHRRRQPDAAALDRRPERPRPLSRVGVQLAGEPARALQPLLGRRAGPAVGSARASASRGTASGGWATRPTITADSAPDADLGAFIMLPEGVARLFVPGQFVEGPWSEHYEPAESPVANPLHPAQSSNPAVRAVQRPSSTCSGQPSEFPIVCTTYRLTEHFHYWTKNNPYSVQLQPEFFVEIPEELAREKGIANGDRVRVTSARGRSKGARW